MEQDDSGGDPPPPPNSKNRMSRVKVACCLCSAAKVRCDQNRPCSRCKSRGTADLCVDRAVTPNPSRTVSKQLKEVKACNPCYLAKVACSDTRPCPRCVRLQQSESCIIVTRRNSSQQQRQRPAHQPTERSKSAGPSAAALISVFETDVMVPASLRNLLMNAAHIRYTEAEIARFVRDSSRMSTLLESLSSTLSVSDQIELRKNLLYIAAGRDVVEEPDPDPRITSSPFSVVNNCLPIDLLGIEPSATSDAVVRFQVDVKNPSTMWNTLQMSTAAETLFGYSAKEIRSFIESNPAPKSQSDTFINSYWKLFHPSSWEVIACNYLDCIIRELSSAQFPVRLMRSDGRPVDVLSSWQMGATQSGDHTITALFTPLIADQN